MQARKQIGTKTYRSGPLPLIAKAIGRKYKVQVVISDQVTVPATTGKVIYLPGLKIDGSPSDVAKLNGFIDHESGHVRFSNFEILEGATPLERLLCNVIEDPRIEAEMERNYPGCKYNFEACLELEIQDEVVADLARAKTGQPKAEIPPVLLLCQTLLFQLFFELLDRQILKQRAADSWLLAETTFGTDLMQKVYDLGKAGATGPDSQGALDAAREIIKLLNLPNPTDQELAQKLLGMSPVHGAESCNDPQDGDQGQNEGQPARGVKSGEDSDTGAGQSGAQSGEGDQPAAEQGGNDAPASGDSDSDSDGDSNGSGSKGESASGAGASYTGTHTGDEDAIRAVLDADAITIAAAQQSLDRNAERGRDLAESAKPGWGARPATDNDIKVTAWRGSLQQVEILNMEGVTRPLRLRLEDILQSQQLESFYPTRSGTRMRRRSVGLYGTGLEHFFQKREDLEEINAEIYATFDISGSMDTQKLKAAKIATIAIGDALFGFDGVKYQVTAFDTEVFTFSPDWRQARQQIAGIPSRGGTRYGPSMLHGIDELAKSEATRKLFFLATDGDPSDATEAEAVARYAEQLGIEVFGLSIVPGLSQNMHQIFGKNCAALNRPQEIAGVLGQMVEQRL